jgi:hypothetical protein
VFTLSQIDLDDRKKLYALINFHGGNVQKDFNPKTTHLICGVAAGTIFNKAITVTKSSQSSLTIITPDWALDCVRNKTLLEPKIYHPRYLKVKEVVLKPITQLPATNTVSVQGKAAGGSLQSIIGFDFEESIAKSEVPTSSQKQQMTSTPSTMVTPAGPAEVTTKIQQQVGSQAQVLLQQTIIQQPAQQQPQPLLPGNMHQQKCPEVHQTMHHQQKLPNPQQLPLQQQQPPMAQPQIQQPIQLQQFQQQQQYKLNQQQQLLHQQQKNLQFQQNLQHQQHLMQRQGSQNEIGLQNPTLAQPPPQQQVVQQQQPPQQLQQALQSGNSGPGNMAQQQQMQQPQQQQQQNVYVLKQNILDPNNQQPQQIIRHITLNQQNQTVSFEILSNDLEF